MRKLVWVGVAAIIEIWHPWWSFGCLAGMDKL